MSIKRQPRFRFTCTAMTVCFLYQLGACPCGCLEHNYWLEILRLATPDHEKPNVEEHGRVLLSSSDCTGQSHSEFVSTSRSLEAGPSQLRIAHSAVLEANPVTLLLGNRPIRDRGPPGPQVPTTSRPSLQVFLL